LYAQNFLVMETLLAVAVYYVMVVTVFTWLFRALENARYSAQASANPQRGGMPGAAPEPAGADGEIKTPAANGAPPALDLRAIANPGASMRC
jgi:polar amino acid transport system permease protein